MNKHQVLAEVFLDNGGTQLILDALKQSGNETQMLYYTLLNIWLLSFVPDGIDRFLSVPKFGVLKMVCEILQKTLQGKIN